eukprot:gene3924-4293_t
MGAKSKGKHKIHPADERKNGETDEEEYPDGEGPPFLYGTTVGQSLHPCFQRRRYVAATYHVPLGMGCDDIILNEAGLNVHELRVDMDLAGFLLPYFSPPPRPPVPAHP